MSQYHSQVQRARFLTAPGHLIAMLFVVVPAAGLLLALSAPGPAGVQVRARIFTIMVDTGLWPLVGLFLGLTLATIYDQRKLRWTYSLLSGLLGVVFVILLPLLILDILALRPTINPEMRSLYDGNMIRNLFALAGTASVFLLQAFLSIRALRLEGPRSASAGGPGLVGSSSRGRVASGSQTGSTHART